MRSGQIPAGKLIAFEGIDGTGKSTQVKLLAGELARRGYQVVPTREPTDGAYGRQIRRLYTDRGSVSLEEELELFIADRRQHVADLILPALSRGEVVITDRYYYSTAAYQGAAGLDPREIIRRNEEFAPVPDMVILLELSPAVGVHRITSLRGESLNAFEQEESLARVAEIFSMIAGPGFCRINGGESVAQVHRKVLACVDSLFR